MKNNKLSSPTLLTINDTSSQTGISAYRIRQWFLDGEIVGVRAGNKILINFEKLIWFLDNSRNEKSSCNQN